MARGRTQAAAVLFCLSLLAVKAEAHRLALDVFTEGDKVRLEVYYPLDGSPAVGASVSVTDESGKTVASGKTDAAGTFTFVRNDKAALSVAVEHAGHKATAEIPAAAPPSKGDSEKTAPFRRRAERREPYPVARVMAGIAAIFSLAALVLSYLTWRRIFRLERWLEEAAGRAP